MSRQAQIGLSDFHAIKTNQNETHGWATGNAISPAPSTSATSIPGLITATITVNEFNENFYSDDSIENVVQGLENVEIEIEVTNLSISERALLLGETSNTNTAANMVSVEANANDIASRPYMSIAFRSKKANGKYRYVSIPKIKFNPPEVSYQTQEDGVERATVTMSGTAIPLSTGVYMVMADDDTITGADAYIDSFLKNIPYKNKA